MLTYTVTVKNNGNIPAIVDSIILTDSTNDDINYSYNGIAVGNVLEPSATHKFNVVVEYDKSVTTVNKASKVQHLQLITCKNLVALLQK